MSISCSEISCARAGVVSRSPRVRALSSTALILCLTAAGTANAQNVLTSPGGVIISPVSPFWVNAISGTTTANINTTDITSPGLNAIWINQFGVAGTDNVTIGAGRTVTGFDGVLITATNDTMNVTNNGAIVATFDGIFASNTLAAPITVSGPGTIDASAGRNGVWILTPGAATVGTTAAPVGPIRAALNGIVVTDGLGPVTVNATSIAAATGYGVWTVGGTGAQAVSTTGAITAPVLSGLYLNSTTGAIAATGNGTSTLNANVFGASLNSGTGNLAIQNYASITAAGTGVSLVSPTGTNSVLSNGPITGANGVVTVGGATTVSNNGAITGTLGNGIASTSPNAISVNNNAAISGTASGVVFTGGAGAVTVNNNGPITGTAIDGILGTTTTGSITANANGPITGANGVVTNSGTGATAITNNGAITGTAGIGVTAVAAGPINVDNNASIRGTTTGVLFTGATGPVSVTNNGAITGTAVDGILGTTSAGAITANNNTSITGVNGVVTTSGAGAQTINNNGAITGTGGVGILSTTVTGAISVNGNGAITGSALQAVAATTSTGPISIGSTAFNGPITGATNGIQAASATGDITTAVNSNTTGTSNIGIFTSTAGNTVNTITAGNVTGGIWGMETLAQLNGNITNTIAAGSTVRGNAIGLVTGTILGVATTNNAGIITTTGDTGAAGTVGGLANSNFAGSNIVNNTGQLIGGVATAGLNYTLNNQAGAVWTPSGNVNPFGSLNDTVNNSGTINVRAGTTTFNLLENFNNQSAGLINMAYNPAATDNLVVLNFSPKAGSIVNFNFDTAAANGSALGFDNSTSGKGTADTIVVAGSVVSQGKSIVNLATTGGAPTALSGSVALVYTGVNLVAPAAGATLTPSANYLFGAGDPSTATTKFFLVDDGKGGVYLQWKPNLTTASLGAFGGAIGAGGAGGAGGSDPSGASSALAGAAGASAGTGGVGLGGGPTGGGSLGAIGDLAASGVGSTSVGSQDGGSQGGSIKDSAPINVRPTCDQRYMQAWGQAEAERTSYSGGRDGHTNSVSGGLEVDAGRIVGLGCNNIGIGFFGFTGNSQNKELTSSSTGDNDGIGGSLRLSSPSGFYAALIGAKSWSQAKLSNAIFASVADKHSTSLNAAGALGYLFRVAPTTAIDLRGFASYSRNTGDPFTDSAGISVSETKDNIRTYGLSVGLHQALTPGLQGFVRGGVKWSELDSSITAFGNTLTGSVDGMSTSVEAGLVGSIGNDIRIGASGYGTFSEDGANSYGVRANVGVRF
jgi:collagen type VII alpha